MKQIATFFLLTLGLTACTPYPRYSHESKQPPVSNISKNEQAFLSVDDYLRLGMIIRSKLGTPYAGSSKFKPGTDCSNLTQEVFGEFDAIPLGRTAQDQYSNGILVPRNRLQFGDLVFFSLKKNRITHVGIYVGYGEFVHASESYGVILSRMTDRYWAHSYVGARRVLVPDRRATEH
jgi:cell wall-associated NlpC family hydrolase